jgi:hypothetical protein
LYGDPGVGWQVFEQSLLAAQQERTIFRAQNRNSVGIMADQLAFEALAG